MSKSLKSLNPQTLPLILSDITDLRDKTIIYLIAHTGLYTDELRFLAPKQIDLTKSLLHIKFILPEVS